MLCCSSKLGVKKIYDRMFYSQLLSRSSSLGGLFNLLMVFSAHSTQNLGLTYLSAYTFSFLNSYLVTRDFDNISGLGFLTSLVFILLVGIFVSSWVGSTVFWIGEWFIKKMPFVRHIYSASKQVSTAVSPDQNTTAFKEVAIISHPRVGEYAFGFITSTMVLQTDKGDEELCSVYVPTNHLYIGDIFLVNSAEIIRPNLSIREGIEIIVSGGMTMPQVITSLEPTPCKSQNIRLDRVMTV
ncbi:protein LIKE COV 2-like isoform X2 [Panicum hallii]|uniref:protein LIKE COV 2-like isoform X2 n=1 Tax=Panicum hallii TaxID=206008 RepID=UPI000DF4D3CA|nr:protein LIKE COV 2-like isoform X2 [Panicum hallii]